MDHQYIEAHNIPERYLKRTLPVDDRQRFEEHFADCPECLDRIALAEVFRNSARSPEPEAASQPRFQPVVEPAKAAGILAAVERLPRRRQLMALGLALLLVAGVPIAFFSGFTIGMLSRWKEDATRVSVSLLVAPFAGTAVENYSVAVTDSGGRLVWAQSGIAMPFDKALSIPMSFRQLPPGDYTVTVRARRADGTNSTVAIYPIRKPRS